MDRTARDELEREIRRRVEASDLAGATTAALRGYGPEVLRFLLGLHDEGAASEVFSVFGEGLWRGIGAFDWASTFRSFAFGVARRASLRYRRDQGRRARREIPLEGYEALSGIEEQVRSQTLSFLKSDRRSRFAEIRAALEPADRALLMLRIDQQLAWNECVRALHESDVPLDEISVKREAARLRKRFQLLKDALLERGRKEGLVASSRDR